MLFTVKSTYLVPKEGTDKLKRKNEKLVVDALSCIEAETKVINWFPSNFQDAKVVSVSENGIEEINDTNEHENWFLVQIKYEDLDGGGKPFKTLVKNDTIENALKSLSTIYLDSKVLSICECNLHLDPDLYKIKE